MATSAEFQSKLDHLPDQPGIYLFRDEQGELLYIGKAAVLSNRDGAGSRSGWRCG